MGVGGRIRLSPAMRKASLLIAALLTVAMAMLANFAAGPALAEIQGVVRRGQLDPRWIENAYLIAFTTLILAAGSMGDRLGRKQLLLWGIAIFTAAAAAAAFAETTDQLVAVRAVQGVGAALAVPSSLAALAGVFAGRGGALGAWAAVATVAAAYGPLAGSFTVERYDWSWVFLANVPVGILAFLLATSGEESRDTSGRRPDYSGIFVSTLGLGLFAYALAEGNHRGWRDELVAGSLLLAAFLLVVFLLLESHKKDPVVSVRFTGQTTFSGSNAVAVLTFFAVFGLSVYLTAYLRNLLGYSTSTAALRFAPFAALILLSAPIAGRISDRIGSRSLMTYGCLLAAGGLGLLLQLDVQADYQRVLLPSLVLLGAGMGLVMGPLTTAVTGVADPGQAGGAAAATTASRQLGLLLGVALLGTVVATAFKNSFLSGMLEGGVETGAAQTIVSSPPALSVLSGSSFEPLRGQLPPGTAPQVLDSVVRAAQDSFIDAIRSGMLLSIGFMLLAAMISLIFVRSHVISLSTVKPESPAPKREDRAAMEESPAEPKPAVPTDPEPTPQVPVTALAGEPEPEAAEAAEAVGEPTVLDAPVPAGEANTARSAAEVALTEASGEQLAAATVGNSEGGNRDAEPEVVEPLPVEPEAADAGPEPEVEPAAERPLVAQEFSTVLFQFPFKAGTGTVVDNVSQFIRATLRFYDDPTAPAAPAVPLPEPIAANLNASTTADIATLTGYLVLEQRFGRINPEVRPEIAATALIGAGRSMKLWSFSDEPQGPSDELLDGLLKVVMEGIGPVHPPAKSNNEVPSRQEVPAAAAPPSEVPSPERPIHWPPDPNDGR